MSVLDEVETQHRADIRATRAGRDRASATGSASSGFCSGPRSSGWCCSSVRRFFADFLPLKDPQATFRGVAREGPSAEHWFGADNIGHDVFSRAIYGARRSLIVGTVATVIGLTVGGAVGLIGGFYRRALDTAHRLRAQHHAGHPGPRPGPGAGRLLRPARRLIADRADDLGDRRPVDHRHPADRPGHQGPDVDLGRPGLRDGVADARARATCGSSCATSSPTSCRRCSPSPSSSCAALIVAEAGSCSSASATSPASVGGS